MSSLTFGTLVLYVIGAIGVYAFGRLLYNWVFADHSAAVRKRRRRERGMRELEDASDILPSLRAQGSAGAFLQTGENDVKAGDSVTQGFDALRAAPQQIAAGDVYSALERGTIDATEFVGPYDDLSLGLVKVAKYYYYPAWWEGGPVIHAFTNLDKFNELPANYQQILTDACDAVNLDMLARYDAGNPKALRQLVADGAVLKPFSEEILDACYAASQETFAEISAENEWFKTIYDSQQEFKKDAYLWMQLAEFSFDKYMMVQQRKGNL